MEAASSAMRRKLVALVDAFQVTGDDRGFLVLGQRLEEIRLVQVRLVADADHLAHAELLLARPVQNGHAERAGLGDERNSPGRRQRRGEGGVHLVVRVEHAQAVRPHEPHPQRAAKLGDFLFLLRTLRTHFLESGGDDDDLFGACGGRGLDRFLDESRRHHDDAQLNLAAVFLETLVAFQAEDFIGFGIDRDNGALVSALDQVGDKGMADLVGVAGRAQYGHAFQVLIGIRACLHAGGIPFSARKIAVGVPRIGQPTRGESKDSRGEKMAGRMLPSSRIPNKNIPWQCGTAG